MGRKRYIPAHIKREIYKRDLGVCQCCGIVTGSEIHHKKLVIKGGSDDIDNLILLCHCCHQYAPNDPDEFEKYKEQGGMATYIALSKGMMTECGKSPGEKYAMGIDLIKSLRNVAIEGGINKYGLPDTMLEEIKKKKLEDTKNAKIARNKRKILYYSSSTIGEAKELGERQSTIFHF